MFTTSSNLGNFISVVNSLNYLEPWYQTTKLWQTFDIDAFYGTKTSWGLITCRHSYKGSCKNWLDRVFHTVQHWALNASLIFDGWSVFVTSTSAGLSNSTKLPKFSLVASTRRTYTINSMIREASSWQSYSLHNSVLCTAVVRTNRNL